MSIEKGKRWVRWRIRIEDRLRYSRVLRTIVAWGLAVRGCLTFRRAERLNRWAESHRMAVGLGAWSPASRWLMPWVNDPVKSRVWREERIGWSHYGIGRNQEGGTLRKSLLIRTPDENAKGVLFISFEYDLLTLLSVRDLPGLLDRYRVVFMGSWSPPCYQALWSFPPEYRREFVAGLSHPDDGERLRSLGFEVTILPLYMSSWQDPADFQPRPRDQRDVDIVMVANWAKFKRHWVLFDALRRMKRPDLRVVLIGQPDSGRTVDDLRGEAEAFGVAGQIEFLDRLPVTEVWRWLERSRVSLVFSRREGSCVVVAESLMANTPVGLLEGAGIGSREFIGKETGCLLPGGRHLSDHLNDFLNDAPGLSPRPRICCDLSAGVSLEKLRNVVGGPMPDSDQDWVRFCCRGALQAESTPEKPSLAGELERLRMVFGLEIPLSSTGSGIESPAR